MKNERIYLAGKITGDPDYRVKFRAGVIHLLRLGWEYNDIVNPVKACPEGWGWWRCMARCLRLLAGCGWVAMLPDWNESRGARIEHRVAQLLRKNILYINYIDKKEAEDAQYRGL
ncbi:MAG: DUF4406 domain-containing protein [Bacteroidales bacterium]|nr:DUF4406 domain-containing protein [Bacteroidales bacterium]